jgi:TP901 family phage tail tape measure protein
MRADPEGFKKGMKEATGSARGFYTQLKRLEEQQQRVDDLMSGVGQGMMISGAAMGVGLGLAAKAAIDWESAWTGVAKVVEGSPEQMEALEGELRSLATTLPQTHAEIAGVAAAAGQLGIARKDIAEFTSVMVAMGVSTDIASEDAAMGMARLMNIMQTSTDDVDRLGSAIVGLGNDGASTEAEILNMALRIAGAGKTVGMTEAEVLGFASALASVGIEAESGGSSVSTAMIKISEAVSEGGDSLDQFATVAGVTADEFAAKFSSSPAAAMDLFVQGLGRIQDEGGDVFATLQELGMSDIQLRDAMLRLAGAGDLLTESLRAGRMAWSENTALMAEAERRYGTTEAQMAIAKNQFIDMGISLGEILLPAINKLLDIGDGLFSFFQDMPAGLQQTIVWLAVGATAITLLGGAALVAVPKIHALNTALGEIGGKKASAVQKALGGVTGFLTGPWGIAIGAAVTVAGLFIASQAESRARVDELAGTLDQQTGAVTSNTRAWVAHELEQAGALKAAQTLGIDMETLTDAVLGNAAAAAEVQSAYSGAYDEAEAFMEAHDLETLADAEGALKAEADALIKNGEAADILNGLMGDLGNEYTEASEAAEREAAARGDSTDAMANASTQTQIYAEQLGVTADAANEATAANQEFDAALRALRDTMFGSKDAQAALTLEIERATEAFNENGNSLNVNSEAGALNHQAVMGLIAANHELISAEAESGATAEELAATTDNLRSDFIELMRQAGFSEEAIEEYADAFDDIPASKTTTLIQRLETVGQWYVPSSGILPQYASGGLVGFPSGGFVSGPGTGTSDSIIARVSNGEFVVNADATSQHRALLEAINSGQAIATAMQHAPMRGIGSMQAAGAAMVRVWFDFSNVGDDFARAIKNTVRIDGDGNVQNAFGTR